MKEEESSSTRRARENVFGPALRDIAERHPSVGEARGVGAFWALDLVPLEETREMLVPYNAAGADAAPMNELAAALKARGLWPFVNFNRLHVVPPCNISEARRARAGDHRRGAVGGRRIRGIAVRRSGCSGSRRGHH